ncbi:MAG: hypothetical protein HYR72_07700 [Deltaproteobacteria bacterium]|nr:hypothetical protein [Deltaproteobacteria bacterium]MBI3386973.1 hypothetical protein [Deltaproteobacteria bacterium]
MDALNDRFEASLSNTRDNDGSAKGWLRQGARDEDDYNVASQQPIRVRNHFFNPLTNSGLASGKPASYWGIEFGKNISGQDYSFKDARGYFYDALTTQQPTGPTGREHYWAQTFYALGHVIHLIQDMAQPQHTRNDTHLLAWVASRFNPARATLRFYEQYADARATSVGLPYAGYEPAYRDADTSTFTLPLDFWHRVGGKGMADYSNRGFVSADTNFCAANPSVSCAGSTIPPSFLQPYDILPHPGFPDPSGQSATVITESIRSLPPALYGGSLSSNVTGDIDFIETEVHDAYTGQRQQARTSTYSIFDPDLQAANQQLTFTLNRYNFDDALALLIPRAVGYSAGMINYFFRGAFSIYSLDGSDRGPFFVRNSTAEPMNGSFQMYWDDAAGNRQPVGLPQMIPVAAHSESPFEFAFAPDPTVSDYTVVFQGKLGDESGAVAASRTWMNSSPIVVMNLPAGAVATDPQNDLVAYQWTIECGTEFSDGTILLYYPHLTNASGSLSGGGASIPAPGFQVPSTIHECCLDIQVTDSQGGAGFGHGCE